MSKDEEPVARASGYLRKKILGKRKVEEPNAQAACGNLTDNFQADYTSAALERFCILNCAARVAWRLAR
jgi:hypothetical protein